MQAQPHYPNAPITEAIIDLRVTPSEGVGLEQLGGTLLGEELSYPESVPIFNASGEITIMPAGPPSFSAQQIPLGYRLTGVGGKTILQSKIDGFTFSQLSPYSSWEAFRSEAKRLWEKYRNHVNPSSVVRVAVRYINRIDVPVVSIDLKEYFRTSPEISEDLPQELSSFFMQLQLPQTDMRAVAVVNQAMVPPVKPNTVSVILDIDLFCSDEIPQSDDAIWEIFEKLHVRKNQLFEACITDKTRRLFE